MKTPQEALDGLSDIGPCAFCKEPVVPDHESGLVALSYYEPTWAEWNHVRRDIQAPESFLVIARACGDCAKSLELDAVVGEAEQILKGNLDA